MSDPEEQPTLHESRAGPLKTLARRACPHWWRPIPSAGGSIMMEMEKEEVCHLCGKIRVHAKVSEPHPTRDKQDLVDELQSPPHYEFIVTEWLPYGTFGPEGERRDQ